ncbi:MAG: TlpA disulfide reductase family protein [Acidimicrobiales bacterium]
MSNRPNRKPTAALHARNTRVQQAKAAERSSRVPWILAGVAVVVVVVLVVAVLLTRKSDTTQTATGSGGASPGTVVSGGLSYGNVTVSGTPLPQYQSAGASDAAIGQVAPTLTGSTMSEAPITIGNDGKPKVVMFLAHWCPHCQAEVPRIQEWLNANGQPSDVELYAVATGTSDQKPNFPPSKWLKKEDWTVPTMVDDEKATAADAYGLSSFPYFVVVGADGKVVARTSGELTTEQFVALIDQARAAGGAGTAGTAGTVPGSGAASPAGTAVGSARG